MNQLTERAVKASLKPLRLLDLSSRRTVSEIVDGMSSASFGARMLGEGTATIEKWAGAKKKAIIIYDGDIHCELFRLLQKMVKMGWFARMQTAQQYVQFKLRGDNLLVVGPFMQRYASRMYEQAERIIFINAEEQVKPGQVKDGYFPDVIFGDPNFIVPVIYHTLKERLGGEWCTAGELFEDLDRYDGTAKRVAHGAVTFHSMVEDPDCTVFLTLSGAMTIAQMGLVICDMIDYQMVQYIASTGALMAHGLVQGVGLKHYKYDPRIDDTTLARFGLNRVTDTIEPETNLDHVAKILHHVLQSIPGDRPIAPSELHRLIGKFLQEKYPKVRGILKSAYQENVPVVVPAFFDSELGNDVFTSNLLRRRESRLPIQIVQEPDNQLLLDMMNNAKRIGIFTIGGGVPRNYTQNGAPLMEIMLNRVPALAQNYRMKRFTYGCRICPDAMHFGHLSGCTYSEGESWRKFYKKGRKTEIRADATMVWPFYVRHALDRRAAA